MRQEVYSIPNKMVGYYDQEINGMIDTWHSLFVSLEEFKSTVFDIGIAFAQQNNVTTWIVDTSQGEDVFKTEVQDFVESTLAPKCAEIGIKYFFVVLPKSDISKASARDVARINASQHQMQTIQIESVEKAIQLLQDESE